MDAHSFDTIARRFASRRTRRAAQVATPAAATGGGEPAHRPVFLFVQPFDSGTWAPKVGEAGTYTLTLTGAAANTVYFSDRPDRIVGIKPTQQFLDELGFTPANPPNAAIVAQREDASDQDILIIELLNPIYDADAGMLTYDARVLTDYGEHGLAHLARQQEDDELGETFGPGSLFIDDCTPRKWECTLEESGQKVLVGYVQACIDAYAPDSCAQAFPDQCANDACGAYCCY